MYFKVENLGYNLYLFFKNEHLRYAYTKERTTISFESAFVCVQNLFIFISFFFS